MTPTFVQEITELMPNAVPAEDLGDAWDPDLHVTSSFDESDAEGLRATIETLMAFGYDAVGCHLGPTGLGGYSLEVQFKTKGSEAVATWNKAAAMWIKIAMQQKGA